MNIKRSVLSVAIGALLLPALACQPAPPPPAGADCLRAGGAGAAAGSRVDRCVRMDEVQVLGTHNSYHVQPRPPLLAAIRAFDPAIAVGFEYTHVPLPEQFGGQGIRQIELDVFADPEGGLYGERVGLAVIGQEPTGPAELFEPGFKVLHVQDLDFESTCLSFVACLRVIDDWSRAHPGHLPITIQIEPKDDVLPDVGLGFVEPIPYGAAELDALDAEIRSVLGPERLVTPDDVRGGRATLEQAVLTDGWPTLAESRGKLLFALDTGGPKLEAYVAGHPSLTGRVMFTDSPPGRPEAGYLVRNDPMDPGIPALVAAGYLVRTRADADTVQARNGDTSMREAALASGAQFISTDYPVDDPDFAPDYSVAIPGPGPVRCNPVSAGRFCRDALLERRG